MKRCIFFVFLIVIFTVYISVLFAAETEHSKRAQNAKNNWHEAQANVKNFRKSKSLVLTDPVLNIFSRRLLSRCYTTATYLFQIEFEYGGKHYQETKYVCYGGEHRYRKERTERIYINPQDPQDTCILRSGKLYLGLFDPQALSCLNFRKVDLAKR